MSRMLIPRLCRQVQAVQCPRRMMSSGRRNLPVFWWGRRRPFDDFLTTNSVFDSHMKDAIDHFRMLDRLIDPIARADNTTGEFLRRSAGAEVKYDEKLYEVKIDVRQFEPEELNVKINEDRLIISGKHEQKADEHGYVTREFTREFVIPQNIDMDTFSSTLSAEGTMIIQARAKGYEIGKERIIKIEKQEKEQEKTEQQEEKK